MLKLRCDIFIPAAVPDVIDEKVARELNCRYVVEAANGPTTVEGDKVPHASRHNVQHTDRLLRSNLQMMLSCCCHKSMQCRIGWQCAEHIWHMHALKPYATRAGACDRIYALCTRPRQHIA